MSPYDLMRSLMEHFTRLADEMCDCRGTGDKRPFDLDYHAGDCRYMKALDKKLRDI